MSRLKSIRLTEHKTHYLYKAVVYQGSRLGGAIYQMERPGGVIKESEIREKYVVEKCNRNFANEKGCLCII